MIAVAIDASGNRTEKEIKVIVTEKPMEKTKDEPTGNNKMNKQENSGSGGENASEFNPVSDLPVPYIKQYAAGAFMGCQVTSLLQALHYKGYATNYNLKSFLRVTPLVTDGNPNNGFSHTPYE